MLLNEWVDDVETVEFFKVYAAYKLGMSVFRIFMNRFESDVDRIFFARLEILRRGCDCYGGPELIPFSSASRWKNKNGCKVYSDRLFWFFSLVD